MTLENILKCVEFGIPFLHSLVTSCSVGISKEVEGESILFTAREGFGHTFFYSGLVTGALYIMWGMAAEEYSVPSPYPLFWGWGAGMLSSLIVAPLVNHFYKGERYPDFESYSDFGPKLRL